MKKIAYVDPTRPGIVRFYGDDEMTGVLAGTRAQMIVDALNAASVPTEALPPVRTINGVREPFLSPTLEFADCTLCAAVESEGFYTGCMIADGQSCKQDGGSAWTCDGKGKLVRWRAGGPEARRG